MVTVNRLNTTSNISIPETIPECEFEECENFDKDEFELSTSLAYGAVDSATVTASRLRLASIISEDLEHTYHNPIYESNPIYETIKVKRTTVESRPNSSVDECESSDHS